MNTGRAVLLLTCLAVAGLGGWFAVARWDDANKVAAFASALGAVAAVGVAIWAALRTSARGPSVRVRRTGRAEARGGGSANSGVRGGAAGSARAENTGDAVADGGDANSGARLD
ncbi:hypothetical protein LZ318_40990 [Saccharopolyspora indica]|uniref:hypothetical protein n=1 Tax=Saccharopolyspora indica TaxID=1229659 RepID=UPI0022EA33E6|nr:hypothetical protein [Saccharopolyspora indica]MDA3646836.1 hypothetical protein [Saccharopolyspora indica]